MGKDKTEMWERRFRAFELHKAGYTERAIAVQLSVSPPTAHKDIRAVLESYAPADGDIERLRTTQNARYSQMISSVWGRVVSGDLAAISIAHKVMNSINVINGLNKAAGQPGDSPANPIWMEPATPMNLEIEVNVIADALVAAQRAGLIIDAVPRAVNGTSNGTSNGASNGTSNGVALND